MDFFLATLSLSSLSGPVFLLDGWESRGRMKGVTHFRMNPAGRGLEGQLVESEL